MTIGNLNNIAPCTYEVLRKICGYGSNTFTGKFGYGVLRESIFSHTMEVKNLRAILVSTNELAEIANYSHGAGQFSTCSLIFLRLFMTDTEFAAARETGKIDAILPRNRDLTISTLAVVAFFLLCQCTDIGSTGVTPLLEARHAVTVEAAITKTRMDAGAVVYVTPSTASFRLALPAGVDFDFRWRIFCNFFVFETCRGKTLGESFGTAMERVKSSCYSQWETDRNAWPFFSQVHYPSLITLVGKLPNSTITEEEMVSARINLYYALCLREITKLSVAEIGELYMLGDGEVIARFEGIVLRQIVELPEFAELGHRPAFNFLMSLKTASTPFAAETRDKFVTTVKCAPFGQEPAAIAPAVIAAFYPGRKPEPAFYVNFCRCRFKPIEQKDDGNSYARAVASQLAMFGSSQEQHRACRLAIARQYLVDFCAQLRGAVGAFRVGQHYTTVTAFVGLIERDIATTFGGGHSANIDSAVALVGRIALIFDAICLVELAEETIANTAPTLEDVHSASLAILAKFDAAAAMAAPLDWRLRSIGTARENSHHLLCYICQMDLLEFSSSCSELFRTQPDVKRKFDDCVCVFGIGHYHNSLTLDLAIDLARGAAAQIADAGMRTAIGTEIEAIISLDGRSCDINGKIARIMAAFRSRRIHFPRMIPRIENFQTTLVDSVMRYNSVLPEAATNPFAANSFHSFVSYLTGNVLAVGCQSFGRHELHALCRATGKYVLHLYHEGDGNFVGDLAAPTAAGVVAVTIRKCLPPQSSAEGKTPIYEKAFVENTLKILANNEFCDYSKKATEAVLKTRNPDRTVISFDQFRNLYPRQAEIIINLPLTLIDVPRERNALIVCCLRDGYWHSLKYIWMV
ncbi:MAG: hypothetical protein LBB38_03225 [Puniceicoccales bacterium]|jgi:hypothetical protein|nr:hypothetical protein [Puniceicoccales bacterium]